MQGFRKSLGLLFHFCAGRAKWLGLWLLGFPLLSCYHTGLFTSPHWHWECVRCRMRLVREVKLDIISLDKGAVLWMKITRLEGVLFA